MKERLQKIISAHGLASRRGAETMIAAGRVKVNGRPAAVGDKADLASDLVEVDDAALGSRAEKIYIMLNKPAGYVTTMRDEKGRRAVAELVKNAAGRIYPVGRLDMDSEGLLIMTNDGEFANGILHPSGEMEKEYAVEVSGSGLPDALDVLREPQVIDGYRIRPAKVSIIGRRTGRMELSIVIHEGRNRQIRKMCANAGLKVHGLRRVRIGGVRLGDLPQGMWRPLAPEEIMLLSKK